MKILVVDDHPLICQALHGVLKRLTRDAVILDASNCAQTTEAVASHPDISLILLDLTLPDRTAFRCSLNYANAIQQFQWWFCPLLRTAPPLSKRSTLARWAISRNQPGMRSWSALFS